MSAPPPAADVPDPHDGSPLATLLAAWTELRARLRRRGLSGADADDCLQDTALRVLRADRRADVPGSAAFVNVLLRNARVDWLRRHLVLRAVLGGTLAPDDHPYTPADAGAALALAGALARLREPFRQVVELSAQEGLSYAEIAARLSIPLGTVKSRLSRALAALRKELGDD